MVAVVAVLLAWAAAPAGAEPRAPGAAGPGYLLHLPGVGGARRIDTALVRALTAGGVAGESRVYDWTDGRPGLDALVALDRNRRQARRVADILARAYRQDPARPVYLTAHSGGTGIAVWALENLPDDVSVRTVVLLASALSPGYDLEPALRRVSHRLYSVYSAGDAFILGAGTSTFGTIDGVKTRSAGLDGFDPRDVPVYAEKFAQFGHDPAWTRLGNGGTHIGPMNPRFARDVLAPLILRDKPPPVTPTTRPTTAPAPATPPPTRATPRGR